MLDAEVTDALELISRVYLSYRIMAISCEKGDAYKIVSDACLRSVEDL